MADVLTRFLPASLANTETQAFVLAGLCFIGSWVLISKIIQFVFSMIWPFLLFGAFITLAPHWTSIVISETIPQYAQILQDYFKKMVEYIIIKLGTRQTDK